MSAPTPLTLEQAWSIVERCREQRRPFDTPPDVRAVALRVEGEAWLRIDLSGLGLSGEAVSLLALAVQTAAEHVLVEAQQAEAEAGS